jgi:hypothetical protein
MPATTASAILTRFETVLAAAPLSLTKSIHPFGIATEANTVVDTLFRVLYGGSAGMPLSQSNHSEARLDRITVSVHRTLKDDAYAAQRALADLCDSVVKAIIADGGSNGYNAFEDKGSRKIVRPKDTDLCVAEIQFIVDYDWNEV